MLASLSQWRAASLLAALLLLAIPTVVYLMPAWYEPPLILTFPPSMQLQTPYYFQEDEIYKPESPHSTKAWAELADNKRIGIVHLQDPAIYGLRPSMLGNQVENRSSYTVSMYHQLHCLAMIRETLYSEDIASADLSSYHIGHCFEYIRQSIMCAADLTLERWTGWDEVHLCKDQNEVTAFMAEHNPNFLLSKVDV